MARVVISEYRAKRILLPKSYHGFSVSEHTAFPRGGSGVWVAKVDEGVKKRAKQGLVAIGVSPREAKKRVALWKKKGYSHFLVEPFVVHERSEEQYLSLERVREGIRVIHAPRGGVDIEERPERVSTWTCRRGALGAAAVAEKTKLPKEFLEMLFTAFDEHHFAFCEMNPLIVRGNRVIPLDAAVLVDSAGSYVTGAWDESDMVSAAHVHPAEGRVAAIAKTTPAALSLSVLHTDGALFFLLSGGGGSVVIVDEAGEKGTGALLGNYGEYSGGPTREETYLYAREIIALLLKSRAPKKALVIAGGVANFTDIAVTFAGIIDALLERADDLRRAGVGVFVRRGGPGEEAGLSHMRSFLGDAGITHAVHGSDAPITQAVLEALRFVHSGGASRTLSKRKTGLRRK